LLAFKGSNDVVNITKREEGGRAGESHFLVFGRDTRLCLGRDTKRYFFLTLVAHGLS
jgi:hypothetical protein